MTTLSTFDPEDYLYNEETIAEYLTAALEDENPDVLLAAICSPGISPHDSILYYTRQFNSLLTKENQWNLKQW